MALYGLIRENCNGVHFTTHMTTLMILTGNQSVFPAHELIS